MIFKVKILTNKGEIYKYENKLDRISNIFPMIAHGEKSSLDINFDEIVERDDLYMFLYDNKQKSMRNFTGSVLTRQREIIITFSNFMMHVEVAPDEIGEI